MDNQYFNLLKDIEINYSIQLSFFINLMNKITDDNLQLIIVLVLQHTI